jgi:hypothetical protein
VRGLGALGLGYYVWFRRRLCPGVDRGLDDTRPGSVYICVHRCTPDPGGDDDHRVERRRAAGDVHDRFERDAVAADCHRADRSAD